MPYVNRIDAILYDGSNAAAVIDWIEAYNAQYGVQLGWTFEGASLNQDGSIDITPFYPNVVQVGEWLVFTQSSINVHTGDSFEVNFSNLTATDLAIDAATVVGVADVPGPLLLGASIPVDVTLSSAFMDTSYAATAFLVGAKAPLTVGTITKLNASTVRVQVSAGLAYTAGAQVVVAAYGDVA